MRKLAGLALAGLVLVAFVALPAAAQGRVVSALGVKKVRGGDVYVDVLVVVPAGKSDRAATNAALAQQGARPVEHAGLESAGYSLTGLLWDALPVDQRYNPSRQPLSGAQAALTNTHTTWSSVAGSRYGIGLGGLTSRCPSLVQECPGPQSFDGENGVGWQRLGGGTLGVTWYSTSIDEADVALNIRFKWSQTCANVTGRYDVETVLLHENGHVAGLGHSGDTGAIMYASYRGARCLLGADDEAGIAALYPAAA